MMYSVELSKNGGDLMEHYCTCFQRRWNCKPIVATNGTDQTYCKDMVARHGLPFAMEIIEAYFKSDNRYWVDQKHPLALLKKQGENIIMVDLHNRRKLRSATPGGRGPLLRVEVLCDTPKCNTYISRDCYADQLGGMNYCEGCKNGTPLAATDGSGHPDNYGHGVVRSIPASGYI